MYEPESMISQLMSLMDQVNEQIKEANEYAAAEEIPVSKIRYRDGKWIMNDLLHTKAMVLSSMVLLEEQISREAMRRRNAEVLKKEEEEAMKLLRGNRDD